MSESVIKVSAGAMTIPSDSAHRHDFKQEVRVQSSLLTPLERRCLGWLVARLPRWVTSDHLTLLGFIAMLAAAGFYLLSSKWTGALLLVNACLAVNWFGDSLDGTLARARNKQRPRYGYYVDHVIDVLGILALVCGLAGSGLMSWTVALAVLVTYYLLSIDIFLATHSLGLFRMSFFKFGPTELRVLLAIGNVKALLNPTTQLFNRSWLFFDIATVIAIALMGIVIVTSVARNTVRLYREERI